MKKKLAINSNLAMTMILAIIMSVTSMQFAFSANQEAVNITENTNQKKMDSMAKLDELIKSYGVTSVQYAIIDNGRISVSGQSGVYSNSQSLPLTEENMYGIGSVSKMFAATSIMKLVEQGKLELDHPVTDYISEFEMADERYRGITVRMLLNHSSGLMGSSFNNAFLFDDNDSSAHDQLLARLKEQHLKADPGAFSVYCNDGYTLAELIVERVSGKSFTDFVHEYITQPLGMKNTKTTQDSFDESQLSRAYYPGLENAVPTDTINVIGAGGIFSTAEDMCRFAQVFMKEQGPGDTVLSKVMTDAMAGEEYKRGIWPDESENFKYGLGWDNVQTQPFADYGIKALNKGGDTYFYHGMLLVLPERNMAAVVLSSGGSSLYNQMLAQSLLTEALEAKGIMPENEKAGAMQASAEESQTPAGMPEDMRKYAGYYGDNQKVMKLDISETGTLSITVPSIEGYKENYQYTANGVFTDELGTLELGFIEEDNGHTYVHAASKSAIPGLGQSNFSNYIAQKLEKNKLEKNVAAAWEKRNGKSYYVLDEKYSSQAYVIPITSMKVRIDEEIPGYFGSGKIQDENTTVTEVEIPGMLGRDMNEFRFYIKDGIEYLKDSHNISISEDAIQEINPGSSSCMISRDGNAIWYKADKAAGKSLKVEIPPKASFTVYDKDGKCINASYISRKNSIILPDGGMIVFAGEPLSEFKINLN
ncbi:MAG: serine hydrolase domain-containing protein [Proteocatella sp.]